VLAGFKEKLQKVNVNTAPQTRTVAASLRALMDGLIDYAGLFPPAALDMKTAVANYGRYLRREHSWALGRFVVPANRLEELQSELEQIQLSEAWKVSAIVGSDVAEDIRRIRDFNRQAAAKAVVDTAEVKAASVEVIRRISAIALPEINTYFEVSPDASTEIFSELTSSGARAKIRTGGVVESAFPAAESIAQFIVRCAEAKVAFKATAGLHHPLRCVKPLTYAANAPRGTMHGFLNVFLAACVYGGLGGQIDEAQRAQLRSAMLAILMSESPANFEFREDRAIVRGMLRESANDVVENSNYELSALTEVILHTRSNFAISFGSCSFEEPIEDLRNLDLL
jgi:hypothetical protein